MPSVVPSVTNLVPLKSNTGVITSPTVNVPATIQKTLGLMANVSQADLNDATKSLILELWVQNPDLTFSLEAKAVYQFGAITLENGQPPQIGFRITGGNYANKTVKAIVRTSQAVNYSLDCLVDS